MCQSSSLSIVLYRNFDYAVEIIDRLVDDETGCPWDRVQTHASLKRSKFRYNTSSFVTLGT
jgi:uncharacterized protein YabN with tetrapyrrole methylase and pyrophosphatase domain